jgi:protein-S-isoprenylcysteine O-methyltransferase Ste14
VNGWGIAALVVGLSIVGALAVLAFAAIRLSSIISREEERREARYGKPYEYPQQN